MTVTINGTTGVAGVDGTADTPAIQGNDTNTGIFFPAADTIAFAEGGTEVARFDSSGNLGLRVTPSPWQSGRAAFQIGSAGCVVGSSSLTSYVDVGANTYINSAVSNTYINTAPASLYRQTTGVHQWYTAPSGTAGNAITFTQAMTLDASGNLLVGTATENQPGTNNNTVGVSLTQTGRIYASSVNPAWFNVTSDGQIVSLRSGGTQEGTISVSGTTVSYNGGHLSRWAQTLTAKDESLLKGTVLSNLDEMNTYVDADGNVAENEQLNKVKVSDVEGDSNVAGVFVNWYFDEQHNVDEINMAMTGDMIIRIAEGVTVQRGDLLMSAGDGTAKPQGDDIVRSKTIAKVTSTHVTCTYADGSYCVPCVLMAC
jgi:hypothetical protein